MVADNGIGTLVKATQDWKEKALEKDINNYYKKLISYHIDKVIDEHEGDIKAGDALVIAIPRANETIMKYKEDSLQNIEELNLMTAGMNKVCQSDGKNKYGLSFNDILDKLMETSASYRFSKEKA